ncbi:MAG TPA: hypothetical protein VK045_04510 [Ornithinicoccus sp.]|nr:hypothetical protein [Ornithinicoccus sp.]
MRLFTARRASAVVASAAALTLGLAGTASAHHCYKVNWSEVAHAHHMQGNTAWMPLSDLVEMYILPEVFQGACEGFGDRAAELYMKGTGLVQEPLIHSKATIGTGEKAHPKGKQPMSIDFLGNHEALLDEVIFQIATECLAD